METTTKLVRRTFSLSLLFFTLISCSQNNTRNTDFEGVWLYQMDENEPDRFTALTITTSDTGYAIEYNSKRHVSDMEIKGFLKEGVLHIQGEKDATGIINSKGELVINGEKGYERTFTRQHDGFKPYVHKFQSTNDISLSDFVGEWIEEKDDADEWKDKIRISVRNGVIKIDSYEISSCPYVFEFAQGKYHKNTIRAKRVQFGGGTREVSDTKLTISKDGKLTVKNLAQYPCGRREIVFIKK